MALLFLSWFGCHHLEPPDSTRDSSAAVETGALGPWLSQGFEAGLEHTAFARLRNEGLYDVWAADDAGLVLLAVVPMTDAEAETAEGRLTVPGDLAVVVGSAPGWTLDPCEEPEWEHLVYASAGAVVAALGPWGGTAALEDVAVEVDGTRLTVSRDYAVTGWEDCVTD